MAKLRLGRRSIVALPKVLKTTIFYDTELTGFGIRVYPSQATSWIVEYRLGEGGRAAVKRRMVLGSSKDVPPDEARKTAAGILARARQGEDPSNQKAEHRAGLTVNELVEAFMDGHIRPKRKVRTAKLFDGYIKNHIAPALGAKKARSLPRSDVQRLHGTIGKTNHVTANRVLALLGSVYASGTKAKLIPANTENPAIGIEKYPEHRRERFLSNEEMLRLGAAIRQAETTGIPWKVHPEESKHTPRNPANRMSRITPHVAAAIRLLIFTGARLREILDLQWAHVDIQRGLLLLPDSKTGKKTIVLGAAALAVLESLPRLGKYVIAGSTAVKPRSDLQKPWALVSQQAGLAGLRLHDLRHSFASVGAGSGLGLPIIGKLLGHSNSQTTERYAHLAADPLRRAQDEISGKIARAMGEIT